MVPTANKTRSLTLGSELASLRKSAERSAHAAFADTGDRDQAANLVLSEVIQALGSFVANAGARPTISSAEVAARVRGVSRNRELLQNAGGACSADAAARWLNMSKPAVLNRAAKGRLIGLRVSKQNAVLFPVFQFSESPDGVVPGFRQVMAALGVQPALDPWAKSNFFLSPRGTLNGKAPIDLLREGKIDEVVALASTYANE